MHPAAFFRELKQALPRDVLLCLGRRRFRPLGPRHPARPRARAVAAAGAAGHHRLVAANSLALQTGASRQAGAVITGDGSLGFYIAEMDTAVRHKLPIVVIVGNDAGWGLERELQGAVTGLKETVACELRATRYDIVMKGFGGEGELIEAPEQVRPAVERAFAAGVPYLLERAVRGVRSPFTEWQIAGKR